MGGEDGVNEQISHDLGGGDIRGSKSSTFKSGISLISCEKSGNND